MHLIKLNFIYIFFLFLISVILVILNLLLSFIRFGASINLAAGCVGIGGWAGVGVWIPGLGCGCWLRMGTGGERCLGFGVFILIFILSIVW